MANPRMSLLQLLDKAEAGADPEFLRDGLGLLAQELMETEVTQLVGAQPYERTESRTTSRNGYREREWDTRVGTVDLQIPKLRQGTYFPGLLEPRRRHERALLSVVQQAYVHGVSTRAVDHLAEALGLKGISKDQVSRICKELDGQVHAFRTRRLDGEYPTSCSTRPLRRSVRTVAWSPWQCSLRSAFEALENARSWAWTWDRPRISSSG
jgi:putative transposase